MWYAVLTPDQDSWGYGSYDLDEAKAMAANLGEDAYIAVIDRSNDPLWVGLKFIFLEHHKDS